MSLKNREIDDKISKIMGSYLLKGYTLLDDYCQTCHTPLMRSRIPNALNYCIYCNEICDKSIQKNENSLNECSEVCEMIDDKEDNEMIESKELMNNENIISIEESFNFEDLQFKRDIEKSLMIVHKKLLWATNRLEYNDKVNDSIQLTNLIKSCADCILSLKKLIVHNQSQNKE